MWARRTWLCRPRCVGVEVFDEGGYGLGDIVWRDYGALGRRHRSGGLHRVGEIFGSDDGSDDRGDVTGRALEFGDELARGVVAVDEAVDVEEIRGVLRGSALRAGEAHGVALRRDEGQQASPTSRRR